MRIKFLETVQSANPSAPFIAGQIIPVPDGEVPNIFRSYIKRGQAVVLSDDLTERAVVPAVEKPEPDKAKGRTKRVD